MDKGCTDQGGRPTGKIDDLTQVCKTAEAHGGENAFEVWRYVVRCSQVERVGGQNEQLSLQGYAIISIRGQFLGAWPLSEKFTDTADVVIAHSVSEIIDENKSSASR